MDVCGAEEECHGTDEAADSPSRATENSAASRRLTVTSILLLSARRPCAGLVIPTGSMEETLLIGDQLWWKAAYLLRAGSQAGSALLDVKRGDFIVFRYPVDIARPS